MIPKRYTMLVFAVLLSGVMTFVVSGIATAINVGLPPDFLARWAGAWMLTWVIACPVLLVVRPMVTRLTERLTA